MISLCKVTIQKVYINDGNLVRSRPDYCYNPEAGHLIPACSAGQATARNRAEPSIKPPAGLSRPEAFGFNPNSLFLLQTGEMALTRNHEKLKTNEDTGFGVNPDNYGGRFVNRDGSFNVRKEGIPLFQRFSLYHTMLNISTWKFYTALFAFYLLVNLLFACIYFVVGKEEFQGILAVSSFDIFKEMYFFSTETYTTVGYGRVNPVGDRANSIAAVESMLGFLSFAIATGLLYGRFSKPKAFLLFSKQALVSPYKEGRALMLRFAAYKDNHTLTNVEIKVTASLLIEENGRRTLKFYDLELERSHVESLPMNWTVVHPLINNSVLYDYSLEDMKRADLEIYVSVRAFDDVYSNVVQQRTSYTYDEILFGRKFNQMYRESRDGRTTILELQKLDDHRKAEI